MKQYKELEKNEENTQIFDHNIDYISKLQILANEEGIFNLKKVNDQKIAKDIIVMIEAYKNGQYVDITNEEL